MLRQSHANAIVIQGLIAPRGLDCLKALNSWKFDNKPEGAPLVAIGAQKKNQNSLNGRVLETKILLEDHHGGKRKIGSIIILFFLDLLCSKIFRKGSFLCEV